MKIYNLMIKGNKICLVFANEKRCSLYASLKEKGFISWHKNHNNFQVGDIIYLFSFTERKIFFKTIVVGEEQRQDKDYWYRKAPNDLTWRLEALEEYYGDLLNEDLLKEHGFNNRRSIQYPMYNNPELFSYIKTIF